MTIDRQFRQKVWRRQRERADWNPPSPSPTPSPGRQVHLTHGWWQRRWEVAKRRGGEVAEWQRGDRAGATEPAPHPTTPRSPWPGRAVPGRRAGSALRWVAHGGAAVTRLGAGLSSDAGRHGNVGRQDWLRMPPSTQPPLGIPWSVRAGTYPWPSPFHD